MSHASDGTVMGVRDRRAGLIAAAALAAAALAVPLRASSGDQRKGFATMR
jgi:hypothetical protein